MRPVLGKIFLLALFISDTAHAGVPPLLSLSQALAITALHQEAVVSAKAGISQTRAQRLGAIGAFLPTLSVSDQAQLYEPIGRSTNTIIAGTLVPAQRGFYYNAVTTNFGLNLFAGGKDAAGFRAARDALKSAKAGLAAAINAAFVRVLQSYEALAKDQATVSTQKKVVVINRAIAHLTELRYRHRMASRITWIQAEQQTLQAETQLSQDRQQEVSDTEALLRAMGYPSPPPVGIRVTSIPIGPTSARATVPIGTDPSVRAAYAQIKAAREQVDVARAGFWPTASLIAQYNWLGLDPHNPAVALSATAGNNYAAGLSINIPLLPAVNTVAAVQSAEAGVQNSFGTYDNAWATVTSRRLATRQLYREAATTQRLADRSAALAAENVRLTQERVDAQQSNRIGLDQAHMTAIEANLSRAAASEDLNLAAWRMYRAEHPQSFAHLLLTTAQASTGMN
jgi:outer membrane protein TolC